MPVQMTRAEYEAKYGHPPTPPAPVVKMTRAEYEAKYGNPIDTYGATFPSSPSDTGLTAGLKAVGNVPSSAVNLGKTLASIITHPIETAKGVLKTAEAVGNRFAENTIGRVIPNSKGKGSAESEETFKALSKALYDRYGTVENFGRTATNDPVGVGTDILSILQGGAGLVGKTATLNSVLSKTAQVVTKPASAVSSKAGNVVARSTGFGISQATGLEPSTLREITKNPSAFSKGAQASTNRVSLGQEVKRAIDTTLNDLRDTGKAYEPIRQSGGIVELPRYFIQSELNKHGLSINQAGKVVANTKSVTRNTSDINAIQNIVDHWNGKDVLRSDEFLNLRADLADLAKYDAAKTPASADISRALRDALNNKGRPQLPGLQKLDSEYELQVNQFKTIKKDYLDAKTGELKDGAASKIANLTGKGKDQVLGRLEAILPGVTKKINILKAVEDIERTSGLKVGTYTRAGVVGAGLMTGNVPVIVGAILAQPEIAVPLIRGYGLTKQALAPILTTLRSEVGALNNFSVGGKTSQYLKSASTGLTIKKTLPIATSKTIEQIFTNTNPKPPCVNFYLKVKADNPEAVPVRGIFAASLKQAKELHASNTKQGSQKILGGFTHVKANVGGKLIDNITPPKDAKFFTESEILK